MEICCVSVVWALNVLKSLWKKNQSYHERITWGIPKGIFEGFYERIYAKISEGTLKRVYKSVIFKVILKVILCWIFGDIFRNLRRNSCKNIRENIFSHPWKNLRMQLKINGRLPWKNPVRISVGIPSIFTGKTSWRIMQAFLEGLKQKTLKLLLQDFCTNPWRNSWRWSCRNFGNNPRINFQRNCWNNLRKKEESLKNFLK